MSQSQDPDELEAPPLLAQLGSTLASMGSAVGTWFIWFFLVPGDPMFSIPVVLAGLFAGYYLPMSYLSRRYTGSWSTYPRRVENIPD